ncbi:uncharacterized protein BX664DRAFT_333057 [Halteromyces radiatus]|uniref:uncharacterized protein n=1 Tax=Halteromyces radiatus TaxID=101107 RepID=UPI002220FFED|nr:uncharacterized protein BX664DRAFT_333057 [Halteromyces radiatus]KAI8089457.1 hypothetical protein BX664DRAFT_333057 [Halteromyces radiatus]
MALTIGWWIYYILTVFCAINNFIFLSLLCMNKQTFITDCHTDPFLCTDDSCHGTITDRNDDDGRHSNAMDSSAIIPCFHMWQETVGWVVMDTMMNLIVNVRLSFFLLLLFIHL